MAQTRPAYFVKFAYIALGRLKLHKVTATLGPRVGLLLYTFEATYEVRLLT